MKEETVDIRRVIFGEEDAPEVLPDMKLCEVMLNSLEPGLLCLEELGWGTEEVDRVPSLSLSAPSRCEERSRLEGENSSPEGMLLGFE
jgi:hypothetical protein